MKILTQKLFQFITAVFLSSMLGFTSSCYAFSESGISSSGWMAGAVAGGIGLGFASLIAVTSGSKNTANTSPSTPGVSGAPVILSSSNHNLLYVIPNASGANSGSATGKIIVKNTGTLSQIYSVSSDVSPIVVDPNPNNSTCLGIVPGGATCTFNISYSTSVATRKDVSFVVKDTTGDTDTIVVSAIGIAPGGVFIPALDDTNAHGLPDSGGSCFVTRNQSGVEFLYAGTYGFGVFKSSDSGATWIPMNQGLSSDNGSKEVTSLLLVDDVLYIGTDSNGVYKSIDGGITWVLPTSALSGKMVLALYSMSNSFSEKVLYLASDSGVFQSSDGGDTWVDINNGFSYVYDLCAIGGVLYGSTNLGVYQLDTANIGSSWRVVGKNSSVVGQNSYSLSVVGSVLYTISGRDQGQVYGIDTAKISSEEADWVSTNLAAGKEVISLCSLDGVLYAGTKDGIINYSNGSWGGAVILAAPYARLYSINGALYASSDYLGGFISKNGGDDWISFNLGLTSQDISSLYSIGNVLYAGSYNGVLKSSDYGANWLPVGFSMVQNVRALYAIGTILYAGTAYVGTRSGVFKMDTSVVGADWTPVNDGLGNRNVNSLYSMDGISLYAGTGSGVFKMDTSDGAGWSAVDTDHLNGGVQALSSITASLPETNSVTDYLYAGGNNIGVLRKDTKSSGIWEGVGSSLIGNAIGALYPIGDTLYAGSLGLGVFKYNVSTGKDWEKVGSNASVVNKYIFALSAIGTTLYASTSDEVYQINTSDSSANWVATGLGQYVSALYTMVVDGSSVLFAGISEQKVSNLKSRTNKRLLRKRNVRKEVVKTVSKKLLKTLIK